MIEVNGLQKTINGQSVIDNLSFVIEDGEVIGVFGVKNTGKSLLLKMMAGLAKPDAGKIAIDNMLISGNRYKDIAYVSEEKNLFYDMTAMEHMQYLRYYYPRFDEELFMKIMEYFQVPVDIVVDKLDFSEMEKVEIALAVAKNTKVLILDDPFRREVPSQRLIYLNMIFSKIRSDMIVLIGARNSQGMKDIVSRAIILE